MARSSQAVMRKCLLGALLAGTVGAASAGSVTYSNVFSVQNTPWNTNNTTDTLQKFDPSLGTLTSVQISTLTNRTSTGLITYTGSAGNVSWTDIGASLQVTAPQFVGIFPNVAPVAEAWAEGACTNEQCTVQREISSTLTGVALIDSANWSLYTGTGAFDFDVSATPVVAGATNSGGFVGAAWITKTGATVSVTYTYVPEPASVALVGMGLLGLVAARRTKKA